MLQTIKTIEKISAYIEMYEKCLSYKINSLNSLKRFQTPEFMDFLNIKEHEKKRAKTYQKIQNRIEKRINNLIKELKIQ